MNDIVLSAKSSSNEIKAYFNAVLTLSKRGENFPIDLDDVWPLCYVQKVKAVQFLTESGQFYENEDYILLSQKVKQNEMGSGGHNKQVYMLSVPCMEYLIARKVRSVFEVYRRVFHEAINIKRMSKEEMRLQVFMDMQSEIEANRELIKKYKNQINSIRYRLEEEKEKRENKRIESIQEKINKKKGDVVSWLSTANLSGDVFLKDLYSSYYKWSLANNGTRMTSRSLAKILRELGFESYRNRAGYVFKDFVSCKES